MASSLIDTAFQQHCLIHPLPVDVVLPALLRVLADRSSVVLSAAPGAGKTTRVPLALLAEEWLGEAKVLMLEPRRIAAQRAAGYMSSILAETVGGTVGFRIRGESRVGPRTRVEVVTEGILTRMLQADPALPGIGAVIFDEFHERTLNADLGLAFSLDVQAHLRPDLRILVMSATLDGVAVARVLGDPAVLDSPGRLFPIDTRYLPFPVGGPVEKKTADAVRRALRETKGDVLVFLPGQREIRRVENLVAEAGLPDDVAIHTLFSEAGREHQQAALAPAPSGRRKVILSTSIAETSITIDGVRVVVDAGLSRVARFDPRRGMEGLVTVPVSKAIADQRRGRAGRQGPGVCYRLWTVEEHASLPLYPVAEILSADLMPLALDLARWGAASRDSLRFIDAPPVAHLARAHSTLRTLGALDDDMKLTPHGRAMAEIPVHPRLAHMLVSVHGRDAVSVACDLAAILEERELLRGESVRDIDLTSRWYALREGGDVDRSARERAITEARRLRALLGVRKEGGSERDLGWVAALAYPDRIARRRSDEGTRYQLTGGSGAIVPEASPLAREEFLAVVEVDGTGTDARVFLAAPIKKDDLYETFSDAIVTEEEVEWDPVQGAVISRRVDRLGALVIAENFVKPQGDRARIAMLDGVVQLGLAVLPWNTTAESLRSRSEWVRTHNLGGASWPDLSDDGLRRTIADWLGPHLEGITRRDHLTRLDLTALLRATLSRTQHIQLDTLAPLHHAVPSGSKIPIEYSSVSGPVLAVKVQEMFGETDTPRIGGGSIELTVHLLSPAGRPLAVTKDLRSFWKNVYPEVRKEMRGRYPRHPWPEDPLGAQPTRRAKPRGRRS